MPATPAPRNSEHVAAGSPSTRARKWRNGDRAPRPIVARELGERVAKRLRRAERIAQHAAPRRQRRRVFDRLDRERRVRRMRPAGRRARSAAMPRARFEEEAVAIEPLAKIGRHRRRPGPPQHRHVAGLAGGDARVDQRVDAIGRQPRAHHAVEQRERQVGQRPAAVRARRAARRAARRRDAERRQKDWPRRRSPPRPW